MKRNLMPVRSEAFFRASWVSCDRIAFIPGMDKLYMIHFSIAIAIFLCDDRSMDISLIEHRELADYIARKLVMEPIWKSDSPEKMIAAVVYDAIEDYTATPDETPDPEDTGRADDFADHYFTRSL